MVQRRHHYDHAFEDYLRRRRVPYVGVDEARKALLPERASLLVTRGGVAREDGEGARASMALKSFDFVVYDEDTNRLVEVKGRKIALARTGAGKPGRLETWVTREDIEALTTWQRLFGPGFEACIVFLYWCHAQPPDGLFQEVFPHRGRWYAMRSVTVADYARHMKERSKRWNTVDLPTAAFRDISEPFRPIRSSSPRDWLGRGAGG